MKIPLRLACALIAAAGFMPAADNRFSNDLSDHSSSMVDVIVQFTAPPTADQHRKVAARGGIFKADLSGIKAAVYSLPSSAVADLAQDSDVVYISPDRPVKGLLNYSTAAVNAGIAWSQYNLTGTGIGVAVIDSGISSHPDLTNVIAMSRVVYAQDFAGGGANDLYGHGTHVAGIIAGDGALSTGPLFTMTFKGMAPNANLVNLRVLDGNGDGTDSNVIKAIQAAIALKSTYNIRVINLSWEGRYSKATLWIHFARRLRRRGRPGS